MTRIPTFLAALLLAAGAATLFGACEGDTTQIVVVPPDPPLGPDDELPGVVVTITAVDFGNGFASARVGDLLTIQFTVQDDRGEPLGLDLMTRGRALVSGPTFNYHRVIAEQDDVLDRAVERGAGSYSYTFAAPIPAQYLAPFNDSGQVVPGELTGQPLLAGTYTVGLELRRDFAGADGRTYRDVGNATGEFLFGGGVALEPREVVTNANCNQCHGELRAHGGNWNDVRTCLLCHTTGAEDRSGAPGTPGASVDFRVMIHKIHAGRALPSVQGVSTDSAGNRRYDVPPVPYRLVGRDTADYSGVQYPAWPAASVGMPRDSGYDALPPAAQQQEDAILRGPAACDTCHGDPDGDGPLPAPAQRDLVYEQPSRAACASCHDDWIPELPYVANQQPMPPQLDDANCKDCHPAEGTSLAVVDGHRHPLADPGRTLGLAVEITAVDDLTPLAGGGTTPGDGDFEPGERLDITFRVTDRDGAPVAPADLARIEAVLSGPSTNPNLLQFVRIPTDRIGAGPDFRAVLPESLALEYVGDSVPGNQTFTTARPDHRATVGAETWVFVQTAVGVTTALAQDVVAGQNFLDVASSAGITAGDVVELVAGPLREFVQIRSVDGDRLWLSSRYHPTFGSGPQARPIAPGTRAPHAAGTTVRRIEIAEVPTSSYTLTPATGQIQETTEFGTGPVLVSYTADYVVPATFPGALNDSPDLGQDWGDWLALDLLPGTYRLTLSATRRFTVSVPIQDTGYTEAATPGTADLRVAGAATIETVARIDGPEACYRCHTDLQFHGGNRRGYDSCIACHGTAGAEDAPRYVYPQAPATPGVTVDFRTMLHKIHHGSQLAAGSGYVVAGFGGSANTFETVGYPHQPGSTADCASCHGAGNEAWQQPLERVHPDASEPTRIWRAACGSCHDGSSAAAHIDANTNAAGAESCALCHGPGKAQSVERVHRAR